MTVGKESSKLKEREVKNEKRKWELKEETGGNEGRKSDYDNITAIRATGGNGW